MIWAGVALFGAAILTSLPGLDRPKSKTRPGLVSGGQINHIPASGYAMEGGRYYVTLLDDPSETDGNTMEDENGFILARCTGVTDDGGSATVDVRIGKAIPAIAINGDMTISGNGNILGPCGAVHANGTITVTGSPTVQTGISATGVVDTPGTSVADTSGAVVVPVNGARELDIPNLDPLDYCDQADYILRENGWFVTLSPLDSLNANGVEEDGWILTSTSPVQWVANDNNIPSGTYCVYGNVDVDSNPVMDLTILATGSVEFNGNPHVSSAHPDGILVLSGGDVYMTGNPGGGDNYDGMVYARSQCQIEGNMTLSIQLLCNDEPQRAGTINLVNANSIDGNPTITFDCSGRFSGPRRIMDWYTRLGS